MTETVFKPKHLPKLDAIIPEEKPYADKFPVSAISIDTIVGRPMAFACNWYTKFDSPVLINNRWWVAKPNDNLGSIRGGHCFCLKSSAQSDLIAWWEFYDQGVEGACVGFGCTRCMSLLNRKRYAARWLYKEAQGHDPWPGSDYEGTSTDAGLWVLKNEGHRVWTSTGVKPVAAAEGISAYRWTKSVDEIHAILNMPLANSLHAVPMLNSWGRYGYPHIVWIPDNILERLINEDADAGVITDR